MKKNTVKSIINKYGKIVVRFFDNEGKERQKKIDLPYTKANVNRVRKEILPHFEKNLRDKADQASTLPVHFAYYADKYLDQLKATGSSKLVAYAYRIDKMLEYFGSQTDVNSITELNIDEFFQGLSCMRVTKKDWLVVLRGIMDKARRGRALEKNILESFKLPPEASIGDDSAIEPFSSDEVKRLLLCSKGTILHQYLGIAFHLGTRPEETIALQVKDIDLEGGIVQIERVITKGLLKAPKTRGSKRSIPLPNQAKVFFTELIAQAEQKNSLYLFSDANGAPLNDIEDLRGKKNRNGPWYRLIKMADVPARKLMQTRHTFAIMAIKSKAYTIQEVASILGHSSLEMIISNYAKHLGNSHLNITRTVDIFNGLGDLSGDFVAKDRLEKAA